MGLRSHGHRAAFSLVETLLTIAILAALAGIVAPRFSNSMERARVDAAAQRLAAEIGVLRQRAIVVGDDAVVTFDKASGEVSVSGIDLVGTSWQGGHLELGLEPYGVEITAVTFGVGGTLTLDGHGLAPNFGSVVLRCGDHVRTVYVDPNGAATWQ